MLARFYPEPLPEQPKYGLFMTALRLCWLWASIVLAFVVLALLYGFFCVEAFVCAIFAPLKRRWSRWFSGIMGSRF